MLPSLRHRNPTEAGGDGDSEQHKSEACPSNSAGVPLSGSQGVDQAPLDQAPQAQQLVDLDTNELAGSIQKEAAVSGEFVPVLSTSCREQSTQTPGLITL